MANPDDCSSADWEYAKDGISLWLNNDPEGAEAHFKAKKDKTRIFAGYAFTTVMNAVISYEMDKIEVAQTMLRELEGRCSQDNGWIRSFRTRIFGSSADSKPFNEELEEKIILADCLMCSAILTFLTQDISGLMRGSWLLRKAWKIYQQSYDQIYEIYKASMSSLDAQIDDSVVKPVKNEPATPMDLDNELSPEEENFLMATGCHRSTMVRSKTSILSQSHMENFRPSNRSSTILQQYKKSLQQIGTDSSAGARNVISHLPKSLSTKFRLDRLLSSSKEDVHSQSATDSTKSGHTSQSSSSRPSKNSLHLDLKHTTTPKNGFIPQVPFSCPDPVPSPLTNNNPQPLLLSDIDVHLIERLMGAVSFGYGIFQLSVSLLPPSLMRLISFFGFEGNKKIGLSCLNYAKSTEDMRAPFATLALLWYYTIGSQLFHMDGNNMQDEILAAKQILKDSKKNYATSAIFLFFRGRLKRLQCKINVAIEFYDAAYRMSAQKELKLLCLHEVGWCRLIQLDFGNAMLHFHELKLASNFSKSFYTYMSTICQGAFGRYDNIIKLRTDMLEIINRPGHKETQIDKFITRRVEKLPSTREQTELFTEKYFKFFVYEMLFLWNTLYSCSQEVLDSIISDCSDSDDSIKEPSIGLASLILGSCQVNMKNFTAAMDAFRKCIEKREGVEEDIHLSAFAHYELAMLLIKEQTDTAKQEAKAILSHAQRFFRNYDFESRLSARIYSALRNLQ